METAKPNRDAAVLEMLDPTSQPKPSPLASLRIGDTLSILGDNYLVDATVTLREADRHLTLARVGDSPDGGRQWLLGATAGDIKSARLTETDAGSDIPAGGRPAEAQVATGAESKQGAAARYGYTSNPDGSVSFWYALGNESRFFTGAGIEDADVEVYGQA